MVGTYLRILIAWVVLSPRPYAGGLSFYTESNLGRASDVLHREQMDEVHTGTRVARWQ